MSVMDAFLEYLKSIGAINSPEIAVDTEMVGDSGSFNPNTKVLRSNIPMRTAYDQLPITAAHEGVHSLQYSDIPSRNDTTYKLIREAIEEHPFSNNPYEHAYPTHWEKGLMENPYGVSTGKVWGRSVPEEYYKLIQLSKDRMAQSVHEGMPDNSVWSGYTKDDYKNANKYQSQGIVPVELEAYYLTEPRLNDFDSRSKAFGMYLRDRGVPMPLVENMVSGLRNTQRMDENWLMNVMEANRTKDWVRRVLYPKNYSTIKNKDGSVSTHKMAWAEADGKYWVYPTIVNKNGKLVELDQESAFDEAMKNRQAIAFKTPDQADWFTQNYKRVWDWGGKR